MNFKFGDKLYFNSPTRKGLKTECIFLRDDNGRAVIMFGNAEWAARANYNLLTPLNINDNDSAKYSVSSFSFRTVKTDHVLAKVAEFTRNKIPYILISNDNSRKAIIRGLMEKYQDKYNTKLNSDDLDNCYMVCNHNITPYEVYDLCEQHARNCGVTVLILDYITNDNYTERMKKVLSEIISELRMDVVLMECSENYNTRIK